MENAHRPTRTLAGIMLLGGLALGWMAVNAYAIFYAMDMFSQRIMPLRGLHGRILHYDEILTMSARMAAATGDLAWEKRYRRFEAELERALQEALRLAPQAREAAAKTDQANARLVEMENRAFALTRRERKTEASALLNSPAYKEQKTLYAQGMAAFLDALERTLARESGRHKEYALENLLVMAALMPALMVMGYRGWQGIQRWQAFMLRGMATGLDGRKLAEESLFKLRQMEQYLASLSSRLMQNTDANLDRQVEEALRETAEMVRADRSYLFQVSEDRRTYSNSHEYCRSGVTPFKDELQAIPWGSFPFFEGTIQKPEDFVFDSLDRLPPEASSEKLEYQKEGIRSIAIVPLVVKGQVRGWLGFDVIGQTRIWKEEEIALLKMLGGLLIDAMDRSRSLAKIQEQAEWLDQAADAILLLGLDGKTLYANQAARAVFAGEGGVPVLPIVQDKVLAEAVVRTRAEGRWSGEWRRKNAAGPDSIFRSRWSLVRDAAGAARGLLVLNTDVSEAKKMEDQFLRTQRMDSIGTLAGGIAHDLNNVLAPLLMAIPLLRRTVKDPGLDTILDLLSTNIKRGSDLVKQVLGFSRGRSGERSALDLTPLVREMEKIVQSTFPKDIKLELRLEKAWSVLADPTQVHQTLLNLCVNARDAMPEGGRIMIGLENQELGEDAAARIHVDARAGRYVALRVEDTGHGIPAEIMEKVFDPFFTTKPAGKGTGIGLTTVAGIMKNHGGFLTLYSEPGRGTRFCLYFPATDEAAKPAPKEGAQPPAGKGERVLVVDDELSLREINRATLAAYGYHVMTAADGAEAMSLFAENKGGYDVVLLDMNMPVMDGPQTIRALRRINPGVRVIASSGLTAKENMVNMGALDAQGFLPKPYGADKLLWAVHDALNHPDYCRLPR